MFITKLETDVSKRPVAAMMNNIMPSMQNRLLVRKRTPEAVNDTDQDGNRKRVSLIHLLQTHIPQGAIVWGSARCSCSAGNPVFCGSSLCAFPDASTCPALANRILQHPQAPTSALTCLWTCASYPWKSPFLRPAAAKAKLTIRKRTLSTIKKRWQPLTSSLLLLALFLKHIRGPHDLLKHPHHGDGDIRHRGHISIDAWAQTSPAQKCPEISWDDAQTSELLHAAKLPVSMLELAQETKPVAHENMRRRGRKLSARQQEDIGRHGEGEEELSRESTVGRARRAAV